MAAGSKPRSISSPTETVLPEGLGHLLPLEAEVLDVEPVPNEWFSRHTLGLGDLVFVVGEDQILSSQVDVQGLPQLRDAHDGAFQVPPGSPSAPRRVPGGPGLFVLRLCGLPEGEVPDILLGVFVHGHPGARSSLPPDRPGRAGRTRESPRWRSTPSRPRPDKPFPSPPAGERTPPWPPRSPWPWDRGLPGECPGPRHPPGRPRRRGPCTPGW